MTPPSALPLPQKNTSTRSPALRALVMVSRVPGDLPSQKAATASARATISVLRMGPAFLP